jgi:steroid 5-alpha reductase family enzyme
MITSLVICTIGFHNTVWFVSLGYTASIAAFCVIIAYQSHGKPLHLVSVLQLGILFAWAVRLGSFLFRREYNMHYQKATAERTTRAQNLPWFVKSFIWLSVSLLYVCMFAPAALVAIKNIHNQEQLAWAGILVMASGLALEVMADHQKAVYKKAHPGSCIQMGLYRSVCRYPNYLGEVTVWIGSYIVGITAYQSAFHWIVSTIGLVCICLIMVGSTKRQEKQHIQRYGDQEDFREWARTVPVLIPFVPLYSLQRMKVYLE